MPRLIPLAALLILLAGCTGERTGVTGGGAGGTSVAGRMEPEELGSALDALAVRIREAVVGTSDRIDREAGNAIRRRTLRFRLRAFEVTWRAQHNPNRLAGAIELWFWMTAIDRYAHGDQIGGALDEPRRAMLREMTAKLRADVEDFARRALPEKGFAQLKERIEAAAANGEVLTASTEQERAIIGRLLEVTQLQAILGLALSPFEALRGIGAGGDAAGSLVLTADRAVDLMERYPELIAWNLRLAVVDIEEQDTVREARAALARSLDLVERLPERLRQEVAILLDTAQPAMREVQALLRDASGAAAQLTALSESVRRTAAAVERLMPPATAAAAAPDQRPFDIREYTTAIRAAEDTLREARAAVDAASDKGLPAGEAAAQRLERAADRILIQIAALLGMAAVLGAGLILLRHRMAQRR